MGAIRRARAAIYDAAIVGMTGTVVPRRPATACRTAAGCSTSASAPAAPCWPTPTSWSPRTCGSPASTSTPPTSSAAGDRRGAARHRRPHRGPPDLDLRSPRRPLRRRLLQRQLHAAARSARGAAARARPSRARRRIYFTQTFEHERSRAVEAAQAAPAAGHHDRLRSRDLRARLPPGPRRRRRRAGGVRDPARQSAPLRDPRRRPREASDG